MKNITYAMVNRKGIALFLNGDTKQCNVMKNGETTHDTNKGTMKAICALLEKVGKTNEVSVTVLLPKNLGFLLKKETIYEWEKNGNKTNKGYELDEEFMKLALYISNMRRYLGSRVRFKMTGTFLMKPEEEMLMKQAWNKLDEITGRERAKRPVKPEEANVVVEM